MVKRVVYECIVEYETDGTDSDNLDRMIRDEIGEVVCDLYKEDILTDWSVEIIHTETEEEEDE